MMAGSSATCQRCGKDVPEERLKELAYEQGENKERVREMVCPNCLDKAMNEADQVRGIAGQEKTAAAHVSGDGGDGERQGLDERT
jgi:DNA-directed RNA polymerase subunit RPC12/RpoP